MSNFNYTNIDSILLANGPIRGTRFRLTSIRRKLVVPVMSEPEDQYFGLESSLELHVFLNNTSYIDNSSLYDLPFRIESRVEDITANNVTERVTRKYVVMDVHDHISRLLDLPSEEYKIVYNFLRNLIGGAGNDNDRLFVSDISQDRRELKLSLKYPNSQTGKAALEQFVLSYLGSTKYLPPIVLNFGENLIVDIINVTSDGDNTHFYVKLYDPLPSDVDLYYECWLASQTLKPWIDVVSVRFEDEVEKIPYIKGPNFEVEYDYWVNTETTYKSWTDLLSTNVQTSQEILNRYVNNTGSSVNLNVDFRNFGNFIFYSAAEDRVANFFYKIELVQTYESQLSILNTYTGSLASNIIKVKGLRDKVISGFDDFEKWLYYQTTGSNFYTSQSFATITPYPKYEVSMTSSDYHIATTEGKHKLYPVSASNVLDWYDELVDLAYEYDLKNYNSLNKAIPEYIREDGQSEQFTTFVNMIGQHFDILYLYTDHILQKNTRKENPKDGLSQDLIYETTKNLGWTLSNGTQTKDLWEYALGLSGSGEPVWTGKTTISKYLSKSEEDRTKEVWRRILNTLPYIYKTKGTARSVKALLAAYGIPQTILAIREYGGPDNADFGKVPRAEWEKYTNYLAFLGSRQQPKTYQYVRVPWEKVNNTNNQWQYPDTLTFRWKMHNSKYYEYKNDSVQTLLQKQSGSRLDWYVTVENNGTDYDKGSLTFHMKGEDVATSGSWSKISAGFNHTTAVKSDGTLWSWGLNTSGQLGDNSTTNRSSPVQIGASSDWYYVTTGDYYTIAIKTDGTLWAWGENTYGELGDNSTTSTSSPIQIGTLSNWSKVEGGNNHVFAIKTDGTLWSWGFNGNGELGDNTSVSKSSPVQIGTLSTWTSVTAGSNHGFAIKNDNTLWGWGRGGFGELGDNTTTNKSSPVQIGTSFSKVSAGGYYTLAVKTDGTLWGWGYNNKYQLGLANTTTYSSPVQIGSGYASVSAGPDSGGLNYATSLAVKTDGTLWGWGNNSDGQVGTDINVGGEVTSPVQIGADTNWSVTTDGIAHGVALKTNNTLWSWGSNNTGQVGDNTIINRSSPVQIGTVSTTTVTGYKSASITDQYLYDDVPLNIMLQRRVSTDLTSSNQIYDLILKTGKYGKIVTEQSASIVISGSISGSDIYNQSWASDGQLYIGSGSNPQTNNILSGSIFELRYWSTILNTSSFNNHVLAPRAYNSNTPTGSFYDLQGQWKFWNKFDAAVTTSLVSSHPDQTKNKFYSSSKDAYISGFNSASFKGTIETYNMEVATIANNTPYTEKVRIDSASLYDSLQFDESVAVTQFDKYSIDLNKLMVAFSPQHMINEDIYESLGYTALDEYLGDYSSVDKEEYTDLKVLANEYWKKYPNKNDFTAYIDLIGQFDFSIFDQIRQVLPMRVNEILGLVVEPNILERSKVKTFRDFNAEKSETVETNDISKLPDSRATLSKTKATVMVGFDENYGSEFIEVGGEFDIETTFQNELQEISGERTYIFNTNLVVNKTTGSLLIPHTVLSGEKNKLKSNITPTKTFSATIKEYNSNVSAKPTLTTTELWYTPEVGVITPTFLSSQEVSSFTSLTQNAIEKETALFSQVDNYNSDGYYSTFEGVYSSAADYINGSPSSYTMISADYVNPDSLRTAQQNYMFAGCKLEGQSGEGINDVTYPTVTPFGGAIVEVNDTNLLDDVSFLID